MKARNSIRNSAETFRSFRSLPYIGGSLRGLQKMGFEPPVEGQKGEEGKPVRITPPTKAKPGLQASRKQFRDC